MNWIKYKNNSVQLGLDYHLEAVFSVLWRRLVKWGYCQDYPADFWIHDLRTVEQLGVGETVAIRYYNAGSHVLTAGEVRSYFAQNPDSFGGDDNIVLLFDRVEEDRFRVFHIGSFMDGTFVHEPAFPVAAN